MKASYNKLKESFGGKTLGEIHPFLIEKYKQKRLADGARVGVNRELSRLRTLFNLCIKWKKFEGQTRRADISGRRRAGAASDSLPRLKKRNC